MLKARQVVLGKTTQVARVLPDRQIRMIGAWCFLDHYGPEDVSQSVGMQVWAHPHTGLQTVTWLIAGEVEHRDSLGSVARVRPGELNIMTAGRGIAHSEISPEDKPAQMHGLQLWVALPEGSREMDPAFEVYDSLPSVAMPGVSGQVLAGTIAGVTAPTRTYTPLAAADLQLDKEIRTTISVDASFEYGVFVVAGSVQVESETVELDQLLYLGRGRSSVTVSTVGGARLMILGGLPFEEEIVMWWNFIGRSHDEVVGYRAEWEERVRLRGLGAARFPAVIGDDEPVMEAPAMPTIKLKSRTRRQES